MGNYREGTDRPLQILDLFFKSPEQISGPGDTVVLPPHQANIFHHEGEIAVVIGREAKDLSADEAMDAVFGYVAYNDISARGLGRTGINSFLGKSFDTFAAFGPWIVTKDEIPDPQSLSITVDVNGERRQDYSTSDMERPVPELLTYISSVTTLHPGDVICCGTNHQGLGSVQDGDAVVTTVSGIGSFHAPRARRARAGVAARDRPRGGRTREGGGATPGSAERKPVEDPPHETRTDR